jgi:hypothetical protein
MATFVSAPQYSPTDYEALAVVSDNYLLSSLQLQKASPHAKWQFA